MNLRKFENQFVRGEIRDGLVDSKSYQNSQLKIAWFLKEAYTTEEEGWHISKYYAQTNAYDKFFRKTAIPTWHPIIYTTFGILSDFMQFDDIPTLKQKNDMVDVVKQLAIINVNKMPSKTGTRTTWKNLNQAFVKYEGLLKTQIEILQPQVNIFANTFYLYKDMLGIEDKDQIVYNDYKNCQVFHKNNNIYISTYHPANRRMKRKIYVDQIIQAVNKWINR